MSHHKRKIQRLIKKGLYKGKFNDELNYEPFVSIIIPAQHYKHYIKEDDRIL